jgi:hypothetical protein
MFVIAQLETRYFQLHFPNAEDRDSYKNNNFGSWVLSVFRVEHKLENNVYEELYILGYITL